MLNSLNEEDRDFTKEYINKTAHKESCSNIVGYKDCVKLLREFGII